MTRAREESAVRPFELANGDRLDSWKEIATHFDRTVRTVQHWEKREALPVHRHHHKKRGSVYAFASELDDWWDARRERLERVDEARVQKRRVDAWRRRVGGSAFWVVVGALLFGGLTAIYRVEESTLVPGRGGGAIVLRRLTDPGRYRLLGRPSSDGRYLSYSDMEGNLALFEIETGESLVLTDKFSESGDEAYWSAVSPDGTRVAYAWLHWPERYMDVRLIDTDGANPRILYRDEEVKEVPFLAWSPDGDYVLASLRLANRATQIALIATEDGSHRILKELEGVSFSGMSLSPDGRYLAFAQPSAGSQANDIHLLDLESGRETALTNAPSDDGFPLWSPERTGILFRSDRSGSSYGLWAIDVEDGEPSARPRLIRKDLGRFWPLGQLTDGTYVFYLQAGASDITIDRIDPGSGEAAGHGQIVTAGEGLIAYSSAWSRNGRSLAYSAGRSHRFIRIRSLESGEESELHPGIRIVGRMRWVPNDRSLLVRGWDEEGRNGVFRVDAEDGTVESLFYDDTAGSFDLSADGRTIYFTSWSDGDILVRELSSGRTRKLYGSGIFGALAVSPDGEWLAFTRRAETLFFMPTSGGEPTALLLADAERLHVQDWTPDGRSLLFTRQKEGEETSLWRIAIEGGEPEKMELEAPALREVRMHPDGTRIAFTSGAPHWEVWAMENFLEAR